MAFVFWVKARASSQKKAKPLYPKSPARCKFNALDKRTAG
jgi:hypothetical protein